MDSFEKNIIRKLNEHSAPYSSRVWEHVSLEINKPDDRRKLLAWPFFLSLGVVILLTSLLGYLYQDIGALFNQSNHPSQTGIYVQVEDANEKESKILHDQEIIRPSDLTVTIPTIKKHTLAAVHKKNYYQSNSNISPALKESSSIATKSNNAGSFVLNQSTYNSNKGQKSSLRENIAIGQIGISSPAPIESNNKRKKKSRMTKICPEFSDTKSRISATVYAGPSVVNRSLIAKNYEAQPYESARKQMENDWISFAAGLRLDYRFYKNFYLSGGMEYEQITEKLEFDDASEERIQTVITIDTLIVGIDTTIVSDTSRLVVQGVRQVKNFNSFRSYNIPVLIGFRYDISPKLSLGINAGASFNIFSSHSGKILNDQFTIADYDSSGNGDFNPYKTDMSIALTSNVNMQYAITQKWSWFVESGFKYYLDPISTDAYILNQRYSLTKLKLGTTFKF